MTTAGQRQESKGLRSCEAAEAFFAMPGEGVLVWMISGVGWEEYLLPVCFEEREGLDRGAAGFTGQAQNHDRDYGQSRARSPPTSPEALADEPDNCNQANQTELLTTIGCFEV